jgi:hypothetical protein
MPGMFYRSGRLVGPVDSNPHWQDSKPAGRPQAHTPAYLSTALSSQNTIRAL